MERLSELAAMPVDRDSNGVEPGYALQDETVTIVWAFQHERIPALQALGVVLDQFPPLCSGHPSHA